MCQAGGCGKRKLTYAPIPWRAHSASPGAVLRCQARPGASHASEKRNHLPCTCGECILPHPVQFCTARPDRKPPTSEQCQAGGSGKRELTCFSAQFCRYTVFPAWPICFGAEICIMPRKQQKTDRPEPVRLFISLTFSVAGIFYSVNRVCRNTQIFRRTSSCPAWTMSPGWA